MTRKQKKLKKIKKTIAILKTICYTVVAKILIKSNGGTGPEKLRQPISVTRCQFREMRLYC